MVKLHEHEYEYITSIEEVPWGGTGMMTAACFLPDLEQCNLSLRRSAVPGSTLPEEIVRHPPFAAIPESPQFGAGHEEDPPPLEP